MKKLILSSIILFTIISCTKTKAPMFNLSGQIKGAENKNIVLETMSFPFINGNPKVSIIDTAKANADGSFLIKDILPERTICRLKIMGSNNDVEKYYMLSLYNESLVIQADISSPGDPAISGSSATKVMYVLIDSLIAKTSRINLLKEEVDQSKAQMLDSLGQVFTTKMTTEIDGFYAYIKTFADTTTEVSNSVLALENLIFEAYYEDIKKFSDKASASEDSSSIYVKELNDKVKKFSSMQEEVASKNLVGKPAPEISQNNVDGVPLKLSDLKGKVVLIDFWASWCGPCRRENPNVVKVYNAYKDKGFTVFSVSLDTDKKKWMDAIKADGLLWPTHVSKLTTDNNEAAITYNITAIPMSFLVDKNGTIVADNLRGATLEAKVKELTAQ